MRDSEEIQRSHCRHDPAARTRICTLFGLGAHSLLPYVKRVRFVALKGFAHLAKQIRLKEIEKASPAVPVEDPITTHDEAVARCPRLEEDGAVRYADSA